jgi:hypothetical protein
VAVAVSVWAWAAQTAKTMNETKTTAQRRKARLIEPHLIELLFATCRGASQCYYEVISWLSQLKDPAA